MSGFAYDIEQCLATLQQGGIILYPTDTVWGIGCDATNAVAVEKIIRLKQRPQEKSFVVLVSSEEEIKQYVPQVDATVFNYLHSVTKPSTVIYPNVQHIANNVLAGDGSVAIRICNEPFCKELIERFGNPIVSTSANISGVAAPSIFPEIDMVIKHGVDYVVKYRQKDYHKAQPSSIILWKQGIVQVIRP